MPNSEHAASQVAADHSTIGCQEAWDKRDRPIGISEAGIETSRMRLASGLNATLLYILGIPLTAYLGAQSMLVGLCALAFTAALASFSTF